MTMSKRFIKFWNRAKPLSILSYSHAQYSWAIYAILHDVNRGHKNRKGPTNPAYVND